MLSLVKEYGSTQREMVLDRTKVLLELRRVETFLGVSSDRMPELMAAIKAYEEIDADLCKRFKALATKPPKHRRPLE
jgi:hypothetical protein